MAQNAIYQNAVSVRTLLPEHWSEHEIVRFWIISSDFSNLQGKYFLSRLMKFVEKFSNHDVSANFFQIITDYETKESEVFVGFDDKMPTLTIMDKIIKGPKGYYAVLMSPVFEDNPDSVDIADRSITFARGTLCAMFGDAIAHQVLTKIFVLKNEETKFMTGSRRMPVSRSVAEYKIEEDVETLKNTNITDPIIRSRIERCLTLIGRAQDSYDRRLRFFDFWTALEAVFGGYRNLAGHIDKMQGAPESQAALRDLKERRRIMIHDGQEVPFELIDEELITKTIWSEVMARIDRHSVR